VLLNRATGLRFVLFTSLIAVIVAAGAPAVGAAERQTDQNLTWLNSVAEPLNHGLNADVNALGSIKNLQQEKGACEKLDLDAAAAEHAPRAPSKGLEERWALQLNATLLTATDCLMLVKTRTQSDLTAFDKSTKQENAAVKLWNVGAADVRAHRSIPQISNRVMLPTPATEPSRQQSHPPTTVGSPAITGFGATLTAWAANHAPDREFAKNAVWDADPELPEINGHVGAHYTLVSSTGGRVLNYQLNFVHGTTIDEARSLVQAELPGDAASIWYSVKDSCAQEEFQSAILGRALGDPSIGDAPGEVFVEYETQFSSGASGYQHGNVTDAFFQMGSYSTVSSSPGC
jgi:hypothetical protein